MNYENDLTSVRDGLADDCERTAAWRQGKAEEYPDDTRNAAAAAGLVRISLELRKLPADHALLETLRLRWHDSGSDAFMLVEAENEFLRGFGFHHEARTADDFLRGLVDALPKASVAAPGVH